LFQQRYRGTSIRFASWGGGRIDEVQSFAVRRPSLEPRRPHPQPWPGVDIEMSVNHRARDLGLGLDDHNF